VAATGNVIPFPTHHRLAARELELVRAALGAVSARLENEDALDPETERYLRASLDAIVRWLKARPSPVR